MSGSKFIAVYDAPEHIEFVIDRTRPGPYSASLFAISIIETATGETRWVSVVDDWDEDTGAASYIWTDGNFSCDCNRAHFFSNELVDPIDAPCGDEKYRIFVTRDDGVVVYDERISTAI